MKLWKKIALFSLILATFFSLCLPAFADVIVEPSDLFYNTHKDECDHREGRQYIVNTEAGYSYSYRSPESVIAYRKISNGDIFWIEWFYTDKNGEEWGVRNRDDGWFRMSDLTLVYDTFSFLEEHETEMKVYEQGSYILEATDENKVQIWNYPGKKKADCFFSNDDVASYVGQTYTDSDGVVWGYIPWCWSGEWRNVWVSLSEATPVEKEPPGNSLKADPVPADQIPMSEGNRRTLILVGSLVGGVVAVTGGVIAVLLITKKKTKKEN